MQRPTKQSMGELKLRRLLEHNQRLRDDLARPRINVSEAASRYVHSRTTYAHGLIPLSLLFVSLIRHCRTTRDPLVRCFCYYVL